MNKIDPAIKAKREAETALVNDIAARTYNRHLLASCGHDVDRETAEFRSIPYRPTVRFALEEAGVIERSHTPEPIRTLTREGLNELLQERRKR